ncbi:MAG: hypothetical protein ACTHOB_10120 [Ginsengibacter sp.]
MENYQPHLRKTVSYYQLLLQRYARRFVQDEILAEKIVRDVLQSQYNINSLVPSKHLRQVLKTDVLNQCYYHIQSLIFDKRLIREPHPLDLKTIILTDQTAK